MMMGNPIAAMVYRSRHQHWLFQAQSETYLGDGEGRPEAQQLHSREKYDPRSPDLVQGMSR